MPDDELTTGDVAVTPAPTEATADATTEAADATAESADATAESAETGERTLVPLTAPAEGVPDVVQDERQLLVAARALAAGTGPLAIDAERASGYRYGQRAYLVQVRRTGAGTWLLDPVGCPDLSPLTEALGDVEWILHAATQDLACLAETGLVPTRLFDTELGARIAGLPRVGLAAVVEHYLGLTLAKEHSAVDWSTRPLPSAWLNYAALDVEVLIELRNALEADLASQGKLDWALEEFDALTRFTGPPPRVDPWRRTAGMHRVRGRRALAVIRELWYARDDIARRRDISPGRILSDAVLTDVALGAPTTAAALMTVSTNRAARRYERELIDAVRRGLAVPERDLPLSALPADGPPPQRAWAERDPLAAARLVHARAALHEFAQAQVIPVENILTPDTLRRVIWSPPVDATAEPLGSALRARGARPWQVAIAVPILLDAFANATVPEPVPVTEPVPDAVSSESPESPESA